jgi:cell division septation protein DedD
MAVAKRKKGFTIKFALSLPGLFGVGVVCFCIFLWMFLLGVWSGQTGLTAGKHQLVGKEEPRLKTLQAVAKNSPPPPPAPSAIPAPEAGKAGSPGAAGKAAAREMRPGAEPEADPAFFAVQVAAFKDNALADKELESWKNKGYDVFSRPPEGAGDKYTRVYLGHFDSMEAAKRQAAAVARQEKIKPFIVLVPAE